MSALRRVQRVRKATASGERMPTVAAYLLALAALLGGIHYLIHIGEERAKHAQQVADDRAYQERSAALAEVQAEGVRMAARRVADRVRASDASERLRGTLEGRGIVFHPTIAASSPPATDTAGVCADLLRRADERLRLLSALADARGDAGQSCERSYNSLTR